MSTQTVAEVLVEEIKQAGTEIVFGLPGGENVEVMDALRQAGRPGVCLTTLGPGATNAYVGMAHAYLDRAPVLLISAETNQSLLPDHTHQVYNLQSLFEPITKLSASLDPNNVRATVPEALALLTDGRPGPVHLSLSREMAQQQAETLTETDSTLSLSKGTPEGSAITTAHATNFETTFEAARAALAQASRPIIVVGVGLEPEQPYAVLQELAEAADAPIIMTPKAKGTISDRHPLSAGTIGLSRTDPVYEVLDEADCIIAVGFDVVELVKPWQQDVPLIWIAPWKNHDPKLPAVAEFAGPMEPILGRLADLNYATESSWGAERVSKFHDKQAQQPLPSAQKGTILPQSVLEHVRQNMPDNTLITTDVGSHKICTALTWPAYVPNRYMLSNGLSAMSFGLTAAIAGAITLKQQTVCITGDAGFGMVMGELSLLSEYNLPVIVVVMNDSALDLIRSAQHRAGVPAFGTEFTNPDFSKIAEAYGLAFHRVTDEEGCTTAIQSATATQGPTLIEAVIDPVSYPTTVR